MAADEEREAAEGEGAQGKLIRGRANEGADGGARSGQGAVNSEGVRELFGQGVVEDARHRGDLGVQPLGVEASLDVGEIVVGTRQECGGRCRPDSFQVVRQGSVAGENGRAVAQGLGETRAGREVQHGHIQPQVRELAGHAVAQIAQACHDDVAGQTPRATAQGLVQPLCRRQGGEVGKDDAEQRAAGQHDGAAVELDPVRGVLEADIAIAGRGRSRDDEVERIHGAEVQGVAEDEDGGDQGGGEHGRDGQQPRRAPAGA